MNLAGLILKTFGWKVEVEVPNFDKCIICVAPHTSNWDFILGELTYLSVGRTAGFLMKDTWFFWPLGSIFRAIGGIPVPRKRPKSVPLTTVIVDKFRSAKRLVLAITPEGTRSRTANWHTGFLRIAYDAKVPIVLGAIDAATRRIYVNEVFTPTGDMDEDMKKIKAYYKPFTGINPDKFTTE